MKKLNDLVNKYSYNINYDADDDVYIGNCAEIPSIQAHGNDPDSALTESS